MLAGAVFSLVHGALRAAPDILAHAAIDLVFRLTALSHRVLFRASRFEETRPPVLGDIPKADRSSRQSLKRSDHGSRNVSRAKDGPRAGRLLGEGRLFCQARGGPQAGLKSAAPLRHARSRACRCY